MARGVSNQPDGVIGGHPPAITRRELNQSARCASAVPMRINKNQAARLNTTTVSIVSALDHRASISRFMFWSPIRMLNK
jgi:hypothetical protein